jgi:Uma2 family endonuclease
MATLAAAAVPILRLDTETYNRMVESGALDGQPVELIDGLLVEHVSPQSPEHTAVVMRLSRHFASAEGWLMVQLPFEVLPNSEPEPDLAVIDYEPSPKQHARSALLVVEVSVSTHQLDRGAKASLYARAGVPTYWLVDVPGKLVEVRTEPRPYGYLHCETYAAGSLVPAPVAGVAELEVSALLAGVGT